MPGLAAWIFLAAACRGQVADTGSAVAVSTGEAPAAAAVSTGPFVHAVHFTAWGAGASRSRREFLAKLKGSVVNTVVVPVKETDGHPFIPGIPKAYEYGTYLPAIPKPEAMLADFKAQGLRVVARIVVFKDNYLARHRPEWAVRKAGGGIWLNQNGVAWTDPYREEIWEYNLDVAARAAALGFDEIQFDYIRFPSDGNTKTCRYLRADHDRKTALANLRAFLKAARRRLEPFGTPMSIAVFGMTTTAKDDMGIGQEIEQLSPLADFVSPMMYPSHYGKGEYGLGNPNKEPYKVVFRGLRDAKARLKGEAPKLRPYLQDFSLHGVRYGPAQVKAQIIAARMQGFNDWILWNSANRYTWSALSEKALRSP
jgi:hypothetical protein